MPGPGGASAGGYSPLVTSPTVQLLKPDVIELIREGKFRELREALKTFDHADIAEFVTDLIDEQGAGEAAIAFRVLPRVDASEVFAHIEPDEQEVLIAELGAERALRVVESMDPDDRVKLLDELPVEIATRIIRNLSPETRKETQAILGYPPESVGRLMTPDYVKIRRTWSVGQALAQVRKYGRDAETINWVYVVDADGRLVDDVHIRTLLLADPEAPVESLMDGRYSTLNATDDREEAVRLMAKHDRSAMPVVDGLGLLVGIVTYDDIADVAEEEATEDIHKLGGLEALDAPYLSTRLREMLQKRAPWLALLLVLQVGTITVMSFFQGKLSSAAILLLFVPMIISSGGNTGSQAAAMLVRALALDHVEPGDWARILAREALSGLALGSILGVLACLTVIVCTFIGLASTDHPLYVGFAIGTAVVGIVLWGSLVGSQLPLIMQRFGLDPAASSNPLVATIMDVTGLTIYFAVVIVLLRGVLL
ncbi:MAG: magnesium transporter [Phycisphaeraceae bacterium]|nr:MAG: magnesium transporter [Phycisphaeraceae bacterium]